MVLVFWWGEVLLCVWVIVFNVGDVWLMFGDLFFVCLVFGLICLKYLVCGMEVFGMVVVVGFDVVGVEIGEDVVGELVGGGGFVEYVCVFVLWFVLILFDVVFEVVVCLFIVGGIVW